MSHKPGGTAVILFVVVAVVLWGIVAYLEAPTMRRRHGDPAIAPTDGSGSGERRGVRRGAAATPGVSRLLADEFAAPPPPGAPLLAGVVTDPSGHPLPDAEVRLGQQETRTDESGRFALVAARARLRIALDGHFSLEVAPPVPGGWEGRTTRDLPCLLFPGVRLQGRVRDDQGEDVEDVRVVFSRDAGGDTWETRSVADGSWRSPLLPTGPLHVMFRHPRYQTAGRVVSAMPQVALPPLEVELRGGRPLRLRVVELAGGVLLPDAHVWLELRPLPASRTASVESVYLGRTGDLGKLETRRDPVRGAIVRVRLAGYRDATLGVDADDVTVTMQPAPTLAVQAVDARSGLPVAPTRVELRYVDGTELREASHRGILFHSLEAGKVLVGLPPVAGTYRLSVQAGENLSGELHRVVFDGHSSPPRQIVLLEPARRLQGEVRAGGLAVVGARVELVEDESVPGSSPAFASPPRTLLEARTDTRGRFFFAGVPDTASRLLVRQPGHAEFLSGRFRLHTLTGRDFPIHLRPAGRIAGRVLSGDGGPAPDVAVVLRSVRILPRRVWTGPAGDFRFDDLPAAEDYRLAAGDFGPGESLEGFWAEAVDESASALVLAAGEKVTADIQLPASARGSVGGRVEVDGEGLACELVIQAVGATGDALPGREPIRLVTGDDGAFIGRGLPPGRYRLRGLTYPFAEDVEVRAGRREHRVIRLESITYTVEIRSDGGSPLREPASVRLTSPRGAVRRASSAAGRAEFRGLVPGVHRLRIEAPNHIPVEQEIRLDSDRRDRWNLQPGKRVRLRLRTARGGDFRGRGEVVISRQGKTIYRGAHEIDVHVTLPYLPAGEYVVSIDSAGRKFQKRLVIPRR